MVMTTKEIRVEKITIKDRGFLNKSITPNGKTTADNRINRTKNWLGDTKIIFKNPSK